MAWQVAGTPVKNRMETTKKRAETAQLWVTISKICHFMLFLKFPAFKSTMEQLLANIYRNLLL